MDVNVARRRLEAEWERLLAAQEAVAQEHLSETSEEESSGELSPTDQHQADLGSDVFEREMEFSIRERVDGDLRDLYDAFRRLDLGTYGRCETCDAAIPDTRLAAAPAARFCVEHERLWELHSMATPFPEGAPPDGAMSAESVAEQEAIRHLEFLSDEDEVEERDDPRRRGSRAPLHRRRAPSRVWSPRRSSGPRRRSGRKRPTSTPPADLEELELRRQAEAVATEEEELGGQPRS